MVGKWIGIAMITLAILFAAAHAAYAKPELLTEQPSALETANLTEIQALVDTTDACHNAREYAQANTFRMFRRDEFEEFLAEHTSLLTTYNITNKWFNDLPDSEQMLKMNVRALTTAAQGCIYVGEKMKEFLGD